jgi:hypothetical protein
MAHESASAKELATDGCDIRTVHLRETKRTQWLRENAAAEELREYAAARYSDCVTTPIEIEPEGDEGDWRITPRGATSSR